MMMPIVASVGICREVIVLIVVMGRTDGTDTEVMVGMINKVVVTIVIGMMATGMKIGTVNEIVSLETGMVENGSTVEEME